MCNCFLRGCISWLKFSRSLKKIVGHFFASLPMREMAVFAGHLFGESIVICINVFLFSILLDLEKLVLATIVILCNIHDAN